MSILSSLTLDDKCCITLRKLSINPSPETCLSFTYERRESRKCLNPPCSLPVCLPLTCIWARFAFLCNTSPKNPRAASRVELLAKIEWNNLCKVTRISSSSCWRLWAMTLTALVPSFPAKCFSATLASSSAKTEMPKNGPKSVIVFSSRPVASVTVSGSQRG